MALAGPELVKEISERYGMIKDLRFGINSKLYEGSDRKTHERIVIKKCFDDGDFQREVVASVKISLRGGSKHILPYYICVPVEGYIVMPYLEGGTLWDLRRKKKGLSPEETFDITAQMGEALEHVHVAGIIHNDFKSSNILLTASSTSKNGLTAMLTDFGFSHCGIPDLNPSREVGTAEYQAPEKFEGSGTLTSAVDIYSLGLVVHEMLTNALLYHNISDPRNKSELRKVLRKRAEPIPAHEKIPDKILSVIRTACEYRPENRYRNVTEMVSDLEKAVHGI